jgi:protein-tyrosine-phosphatase
MAKKKLLFICTMNTCRSPMAEILYNSIPDNQYEAFSRGFVGNGQPLNQGVFDALVFYDPDLADALSGHISKEVTAEDIATAEQIFTMGYAHMHDLLSFFPESDAESKASVLTDFLDEPGEVDDPYNQDQEVYDACMNRLLMLTRKLYQRLHS